MEWEYITPNSGGPGTYISLNFILRSALGNGTTGIKIDFLHISVRAGQAVSLCLNLEV